MIKALSKYLLWIMLFISPFTTYGQEKTLTIALLPFFSSSPVFIADDYDFFHDQGLKVQYLYMTSAQNVALAVATGEADVGVTGLTAGFLNLARKGKLKIIASQYQEKQGWNGSSYLACNKAFDDGLTSPDKLPGHRLGMTQIGSTFHRWYGALAETLNISIKQFDLVPLQSVSGMISALSGCHIDAMIALPQITDKLVREKKAHRIGSVADYTPGQVGIAFASVTALDKRKSDIQSFLKSYQQATHLYHQALITQPQPYPSSSVELLNRINKHLKPPLPKAMLAKSVLFVPENATPDAEDIRNTLQWFQEQELVAKDISLHDIMQLDLLKANDEK